MGSTSQLRIENAAITPVRTATVMNADTRDTVHSLSSINTLLFIISYTSELAHCRLMPALLPSSLLSLPSLFYRSILFTLVNGKLTIKLFVKPLFSKYRSISYSVSSIPFALVNTLSKYQDIVWLAPAGICVPVSCSRSGPGITLKEIHRVWQQAWHL